MITTTSTRTNDVRPRLPEISGAGRIRQRIQAEFIEMPGLTLTLPQAARLCGLTAPQAMVGLAELIDGGFLMRDPKDVYRRRGSCPRCS